MKTSKEMREISDNVIIKNLLRKDLEIFNILQKVIDEAANEGEYYLYIPEGSELFSHIGKYNIKKVFNILGYEIEVHKQQVGECEFNIIGYTIKW